MRRRHARSRRLHRQDLQGPGRRLALSRRLGVWVAIGLLAVTGSASAGTRHRPAADRVEVWLTTADGAKRLHREPDLAPGAADPGAIVVTVDPARRFQRMVGFGAAVTDASAYVIRHDLSPARRDALMRELFSPAGLNLSFVRLTIGASDFSRTDYSYDDAPAGERDPGLRRFSIEPARADLIPLLRQALRLNPQLRIMASPWSAPGWMKTSRSLIKGGLEPEAYPYFADYLVRYVQAMRREGVPVFALTVQNEPGFEPADYPGMLLPPEARAGLIGGFLGPELRAKGLKTEIFDFDHNWDEPQSPLGVLADDRARPYVSAVAWHCYKGDVAAQGPVHEAHPDKDAYFTECSGGDWAPGFGDSFDWMMSNLIIGSTRGWARGVLLWNLALDEYHGPHLGGCSNCRGVVTIDTRTGEVVRNVEYYALGHASRFVRAGAWRISAESSSGDVKTVAFRNAGDGTLVVIVLNTARQARTVAVDLGGRRFDYALPSGAAATFVRRPMAF
jgi:glucosylceramidase